MELIDRKNCKSNPRSKLHKSIFASSINIYYISISSEFDFDWSWNYSFSNLHIKYLIQWHHPPFIHYLIHQRSWNSSRDKNFKYFYYSTPCDKREKKIFSVINNAYVHNSLIVIYYDPPSQYHEHIVVVINRDTR